MSKQVSAPVKIRIKPREKSCSALSPQEMATSRKQKEYTIVVTGCTGRGKSTFCNFLSRSNKFKSDIPGSEMGSGEFGEWGAVAADLTGTQYEVVENWMEGVTLRIIDLPGYLATQNQTGNEREDLAKDGKLVLDEFAKAMMHAKDGVDAIFVTLKAAERYTREEQLLIDFISLLQFWDHCILLFTHGDKVGKHENERYDKIHKLIASQDFPSRCPVLHKMLQYVNNRFVIVESVNKKGDHEYYHSKMDELCKAVEVVREKTGTIIHPLLKVAKKACEMNQEASDLREDKSYIQAQLEQTKREREKYDETCKSLQEEVQREKAEKERLSHKLQEEEDRQVHEKVEIQIQLERAQRERDEKDEDCKSLQAELQRERAEKEKVRKERTTISHRLEVEENIHTQLHKQRQDLREALEQKQMSNAVQDSAGLQTLIRWLEDPQAGPAEVADMIANLSMPPRRGTAEPRVQSRGRTRVEDSLTSSAVREGEPVSVQRDDGGGMGSGKRQQKCSLF